MSLMIALITISITTSLVMVLMLCICRRIKSKTNPNLNSNLNNSNNLLPLNSIRNRDLSTNLELIRFNGNNGLISISIEESDNQLRHNINKQMTLNRALPDIPSLVSTSSQSTQNGSDLSREINEVNESQHKSQSSGRSSKPSKARAPQPPINRFNNNNDSQTLSPSDTHTHHPYARIKDKSVLENDTNDYCDPQLCSASTSIRNESQNNDIQEMSPPVPAKRFANNELNSDLGLNACNSIANRVPSQDIPYMTPPPIRLANIDAISQLSNDEIQRNESKNEISYNTISVREPLAKVLAERANSEHHYNEVEEERVSSFYEEIAGSTASSGTYSKIGDIMSTDNNVTQVLSDEQQNDAIDDEPPALPSLESLMQARAESSSSASPLQSITSIEPICESISQNNYPKDLYSSVDKKAKTKSYNRQTIHCVPDLDNEFDDLYAKVQKVTHNNISKADPLVLNQRPSSASEDRCDSVFTDSHSHTLSDNTKPPPLPPPLNKCFHPRSSRTTSMYDSSNIVPNSKPSSHQRRYSSGNQSINDLEWRAELNDYFQYESIRNEIDLESDPGYEVIKKKPELKNFRTQPEINTSLNGVLIQPSLSAVDPGYEAIGFDESDLEPAYETISKKAVINNDIEIEPGYEVIKRVPQIHNSLHFDSNIIRTVSDVSSEPGYERIRFTQKFEDEIDSEPKYASISRTVEFYEDEEEEERLTERL